MPLHLPTEAHPGCSALASSHPNNLGTFQPQHTANPRLTETSPHPGTTSSGGGTAGATPPAPPAPPQSAAGAGRGSQVGGMGSP